MSVADEYYAMWAKEVEPSVSLFQVYHSAC